MSQLVVRNITNTNMSTKKLKYNEKVLFPFFNGFFKFSNICGGTQPSLNRF